MESPTSPDKRYTIEVSEKQLRVLISSTEIMSRIGLGQFWIILDHICSKPFHRYGSHFTEVRERLVQMAADLLNAPKHASFGIHSPQVHERHRIAWDLHRVFRHRASWDRHPEGGIGVCFDEPYGTSDEPLAKIVAKTPGS